MSFRGACYVNLWVTSDPMKQDANTTVFYYYYDQLCKAISSSPRITHEVTDTYDKIICFIADRHHIYLKSSTQRMTQEDIEHVINDRLEIWVEKLEKEKEQEKGKGKEKETEPEKEKEEVKEKDKGKATTGEKRPSTTDIGSLSRKKRKSSKWTYHAVLHEDDFESIADRVYDTMLELITTITTMQEALKQTIETQLTELKTLVSHAPQVATPSTIQRVVMDPEGNRHKFVSCRPSAQEGLQESSTDPNSYA